MKKILSLSAHQIKKSLRLITYLHVLIIFLVICGALTLDFDNERALLYVTLIFIIGCVAMLVLVRASLNTHCQINITDKGIFYQKPNVVSGLLLFEDIDEIFKQKHKRTVTFLSHKQNICIRIGNEHEQIGELLNYIGTYSKKKLAFTEQDIAAIANKQNKSEIRSVIILKVLTLCSIFILMFSMLTHPYFFKSSFKELIYRSGHLERFHSNGNEVAIKLDSNEDYFLLIVDSKLKEKIEKKLSNRESELITLVYSPSKYRLLKIKYYWLFELKIGNVVDISFEELRRPWLVLFSVVSSLAFGCLIVFIMACDYARILKR